MALVRDKTLAVRPTTTRVQTVRFLRALSVCVCVCRENSLSTSLKEENGTKSLGKGGPMIKLKKNPMDFLTICTCRLLASKR